MTEVEVILEKIRRYARYAALASHYESVNDSQEDARECDSEANRILEEIRRDLEAGR